jgi:lysophospholipase L1-like esterase
MAEPFRQEIETFERQDRRALPPANATLFLGSSTIRLWPSLARDFPGIPVINRGFGGSQIEDSIRYAGRIVVPVKPAAIVFYAGDNDLAAGKSPEQVFADYQRLVTLLHRSLPETRILFLAIKPSPCRAHLFDAIRQANALIRDWIRPAPRLEYVDVFTPMLGRPGLFGRDGLHMNTKGYALWTRILSPFLEPAPPPPPGP